MFEELVQEMRADPDGGRAGNAPGPRRSLDRADRRPGHEHRRGHRLPRDRRGRGPEPLTSRPADPRPLRLHRQLRAEPPRRRPSFATGAAPTSRSTARARTRRAVHPLTVRVLAEAGHPVGRPAFQIGGRVPRPGLRRTSSRSATMRARSAPSFPASTNRCTGATTTRPRVEGPDELRLAAFRRTMTAMGERINQFVTLATKTR